jgi:hypothetical protein
MRLDLIDEFRLDLHPYVAGECYMVRCDLEVRRNGARYYRGHQSAARLRDTEDLASK